MINITPSTEMINAFLETQRQKKQEPYFDLTKSEKEKAIETFERLYEEELNSCETQEAKVVYGDREVVYERYIKDSDKAEAKKTVLESIENHFDDPEIFDNQFEIWDEENDVRFEQETKDKQDEVIRFLKYEVWK